MPRQARMTSATCVYHTILRGVNKQQVFEDEEDYLRFLNKIGFVSPERRYEAPTVARPPQM